jgi:hypothetical protein
MTLSQAAAIVGTTPDNLRGAIHRGSLKASPDSITGITGKITVYLIEPEELDAYATNYLGRKGRKPNTSKE